MSQWYLIATKPKQELRAKENLENQGINCFLPTVEIEIILRGKRLNSLEPLFKSYLFIELDSDDKNWSKIRSTRGVRDFVRFGLKMAKAPNSLIEQLKNDVSKLDNSLIKTNVPREGEPIKIIAGAFKDLDGIYQKRNGDERSIILLNLLNKVIEMDVSNKDMIKLEQ